MNKNGYEAERAQLQQEGLEPRMCSACERGDHRHCGLQTWCECDCDPDAFDIECFEPPEKCIKCGHAADDDGVSDVPLCHSCATGQGVFE